jgi:hypothetical protein
MPWGVVAGAVVGAVASNQAAKSNAKAQKQAAEIGKAPWAEQQPYVLNGYAGAEAALNKANAMGEYKGDYAAQVNPFQTQGYNLAGDFAGNQGIQGANTVFGAGNANIGAATAFGGNAQAMFSKAGQDPTKQIMANAGQYAQSPYLDGQIDAASRDINRNLRENQLTGLDLAATGGGNMNSSRTGVAQGIMERGAADRVGDISAQMRGEAYNHGLSMSQSQYNQGMQQMSGANGQLLQAGQFGADQIGNGINLGYGAGDAMSRAGAGMQGLQQNQIDAARQQWMDRQNSALDLQGKYMGIINGNFSSSGGAQIAPVNRTQDIMSGAMGGMALYGKWNASQQGSPNAQNVQPQPYQASAYTPPPDGDVGVG